MKYTVYDTAVSQDKRQEANEKLLYLIDSGKAENYGISSDDIYNLYTGDGGLHGLRQQDYDNYASYSEAKKEIENGQFFTPPMLCRMVAEALSPPQDAAVADLTCGAGAFFNFMPTESNLYGCELDIKAYKVARYLYPRANLVNGDIRSYQPSVRFDYVVGNPPYNLRWWVDDDEEVLSQLYYCRKAAELLKPFGILAMIVPASFLSDDFSDGTSIREMEERFSFLGHVALPSNAFSSLGVRHYCLPNRLALKWSMNCSASMHRMCEMRLSGRRRESIPSMSIWNGYFMTPFSEKKPNRKLPERLPAGNMRESRTTRFPITKNGRISIWTKSSLGCWCSRLKENEAEKPAPFSFYFVEITRIQVVLNKYKPNFKVCK